MDIRKSVYLVFVLIFFSKSIFAAETSDNLVIHTGFFKNPTYTVDGQSEQPLYEGVEIHPKLESILSANPQALAEAKKAASYNGLSLLGSAIMVVGGIMQLSGAMQQKKDIDNGDLSSSSETEWTPIYVLSAGAIISVIANNLIFKHWNNSAKLFNEDRVSRVSRNRYHLPRVSMKIALLPDLDRQNWKLSGILKYSF